MKVVAAIMLLNDVDVAVQALTGSLPPSMAYLTSLQHLDLTDSDIHGTIPAVWFSSHISLGALIMVSARAWLLTRPCAPGT